MFEIGGFSQNVFNGWGSRPKELASKGEVFKVFDEDLKRRLWQAISQDGFYKGGQYLLFASLVKQYDNGTIHQFPELAEHLKASGWKVVKTFKNSNTGNIVEVLQKVLKTREINRMKKEFYSEEEDS